MIPTVKKETPDYVVIHIGSNDITKQNYKKVDAEDIAKRIIGIGLKCRYYCDQKIAISSYWGEILMKSTRLFFR